MPVNDRLFVRHDTISIEMVVASMGVPESKAPKLYADRSVFAATFLGGPLGGAAIIALNYRALGDDRNFRLSVVVGFIGSVAILAACSMLPESASHSGAGIPIIIAASIQMLAKRLQGDAVAKHTALGGELASGWLAAGVGLLSLVLTIAVVVAICFVIP